MKKRIPIIILIMTIFLAGVAILSYPLVSSVVNNMNVRSEAYTKLENTESMDTQKIEQLFDEADKYNSSLTDTVILTDPFDEEAYEKIGEHYENTLNVDGEGLIGYVEIPKINVFLPIFHGTSTEVLEKGVGHLSNTSLPVGGEDTHSVISGHSAFPSRIFFDYLTDMEEGDKFYIHVLNRTLEYEVDQIKTVLPDNVDDLYIVDGEDYVTLMTCTPYTVNTHRLLVRGKRTENDGPEDGTQEGTIDAVITGGNSIYFLGYKISYLTAALIIGGFVLAVVLIVVVIIYANKRRSKGEAKDDD